MKVLSVSLALLALAAMVAALALAMVPVMERVVVASNERAAAVEALLGGSR